MTPPATREKTPKRKRNDRELALTPFTPAITGNQEQALSALIAAFTAAATTAAGATTALNTPSSGTSSSSNHKPDIQFDYGEPPDDNEAKVKNPPTIPRAL
jgi:hypothetical protein